MGVAAGLVILMMSVTGVLLTYERQILLWDEQQYYVSPQTDQVRLTADQLLSIAQVAEPEHARFDLKFVNDDGAPVSIRAGRDRTLLVDPYSGDILRDGIGSTAEALRWLTRMHRWFAAGTERFDFARAITAYSNVLFIGLMLSGIYLWLPNIWRWPVLRTRIWFSGKAKNSKLRDFNWHQVFSFWALIPLLLISLTATVFYFPWSSSAIYAAYGETPPSRGGRNADEPQNVPANSGKTLESLLVLAKAHAAANDAADWHSIRMTTDDKVPATTKFTIDRSIGRRPALAYDLTLSGIDGSVQEYVRNEDYTPGRQARRYVRFLHTGEVYGFFGQTIAGLASLAACFLVYTGLALAWRRLVSPLLKKSRNRPLHVS